MKTKVTQIQYGNDWFNNYLVYTEYINNKGEVVEYTVVDQDNKTITDAALIESVLDYIDNV